MKVLITGGSGFIGTNLIAHGERLGWEMLNLDINPPKAPAQASYWERADIRDEARMADSFGRFQPVCLVHLAARTDLDETRDLTGYDSNMQGVRAVLAAAKGTSSLQRVLVASSRLVCRIGYQPANDTDYQPTTLYGQSKIETERIVRTGGLAIPWCLLRFTSIWGPYFGVPYRAFFMQIAGGRYVHPRGRRILKSFGYVGNTVAQLHALLEAPAEAWAGRTMYIGDDPPLEVLEWANMIRSALGLAPVPEVPVVLLKAAAAAGDLGKALGWREPPLTRFRLENLLTPMVYDLAPINRVAGPPRISLEQGVADTVSWLRQQGEI